MSISYFFRNRQITSKLVLAIIALTSVSALLIPTYAVPTIRSADIFDGEVKTADLANGAVTNPKLANDAVTSGKIKNGEVTSDDIKDATIQAGDIADGVIPDGGGAINKYIVTETVQVPPSAVGSLTVNCEEGGIATGGGYNYLLSLVVHQNLPTSDNGWRVSAFNELAGDVLLQGYVVCVESSP